jgi:hypothetical protein
VDRPRGKIRETLEAIGYAILLAFLILVAIVVITACQVLLLCP